MGGGLKVSLNYGVEGGRKTRYIFILSSLAFLLPGFRVSWYVGPLAALVCANSAIVGN